MTIYALEKIFTLKSTITSQHLISQILTSGNSILVSDTKYLIIYHIIRWFSKVFRIELQNGQTLVSILSNFRLPLSLDLDLDYGHHRMFRPTTFVPLTKACLQE